MSLETEIRNRADKTAEELQCDLRALTLLDALAGGGSEADAARRACWLLLTERGETPCFTLGGSPTEAA